MGLFNKGDKMSKKDYDYLDEERKKLWLEVRDIQKTVTEVKKIAEKKPNDYEKEARSASKKASEFRNKIKEKLEEIEELQPKIEEVSESIDVFNEAYNNIATAQTQALKTTEIYTNVVAKNTEIQQNLVTANTALAKSTELKEKIETSSNEVSSYSTKIAKFHSDAAELKSEIKDIYDEILGYTYKDEDGEEVDEEGLKAELEKAYSGLESKLKTFDKNLIDFKQEKEKEYNDFLETKKEEHEAINKRIENLLPGAMTAGLSHAYEKKRKTEEEERIDATKSFSNAIKGLVGVSLIPFSISIYLLIKDKSLENVILQLPRMVLAILPLYVPVFWWAISANKKVNLSKRLIEEYAHKEALSKTIEGLSKQIEEIEDDEISKELRIKLLFNMLEVSSENPGKLILNYNNSDNPILDALNKSVSLGASLEKISKIPGMEVILQKVVNANEQKKKKKSVLAKTGVETEDASDADEE